MAENELLLMRDILALLEKHRIPVEHLSLYVRVNHENLKQLYDGFALKRVPGIGLAGSQDNWDMTISKSLVDKNDMEK